MSSEPAKMFSRYIHDCCTCRIISSVSEMCDSVFSQNSICTANALKKRDAFMVDNDTWLSSRAVLMSSTDRIRHEPLYETVSISCVFQNASMFVSACSIISSFDAVAESPLMKSPTASSPSDITKSIVNECDLWSNCLPISSLSCTGGRKRLRQPAASRRGWAGRTRAPGCLWDERFV